MLLLVKRSVYYVHTDILMALDCVERAQHFWPDEKFIRYIYYTYSIVYRSYTLCSQRTVPLNVSAGWHWIEMGFLVK